MKFHAMKSKLFKLASEGCGHGAWCRCIVCRVRRVVQTEHQRTIDYDGGHPWKVPWTVGKQTRLIDWRGGLIEFANNQCEFRADPPWYGVELSGRSWSGPWFYWLDYLGPPQLYLTRKAATQKAKELRKQYECHARVVPVMPI